MVNVLTEIVINKPLDVVANYAANPDNAPEWYVNIKSSERLPTGEDGKSPQTLTVGSQIRFNAEFLGRKLAYTYEIIEYTPGQKLIMRTAEGPFPMETTYTWNAGDSGKTLMTLRNTGQPSGFSKWFAPIIEYMMKKANKKDLKKIKEILEGKSF